MSESKCIPIVLVGAEVAEMNENLKRKMIYANADILDPQICFY